MRKRMGLLSVLLLLTGVLAVAAGCDVEKHEHTLQYHAALAATCETDGNREYWQCSTCDGYFSDAAGKRVYGKNAWVIPKTGHDCVFHAWEWADDYTSAQAVFYCKNDGAHIIREDATITSVTDATCTTAGEKTYTATVVKDGQTYTDSHTAYVLFSHDVVKTAAVAATCTTAGNGAYWQCEDCQGYFDTAAATHEIEKDSWILPATGHTLTKTAATEASCRQTGNTEYWTCGGCGNYYADGSATQEIAEGSWVLSATGHNFVDDECTWCGMRLNGVYTNTQTAVYDESLQMYILPTTVSDDEGNTYQRYILTPTVAGADNEFTVSGEIDNGQIYLNDETETYAVVVNLDGATVRCLYDSPLYFLNADKVELSAKKNTTNYVYDKRDKITTEEADTSTYGKGAIYAKCDLKLKGNGTLYVEGNYNNGVHTTKDLTIKNLSLHVTAYNNGIKGGDSLTVESGTLSVVSTAGDGLKTSNSDLSSKGNQRGTITVSGGTIKVYASFDGFDASFDVAISGNDTLIEVYTWTYAKEKNSLIDTSLNSYATSSSSGSNSLGGMFGWGGGRPGNQGGGGNSEGNTKQTTYSCKGIAANNQILITGGALTIYSVDDALHANSGNAITSGVTPLGNVCIEGGNIQISSEDDAVHGDGAVKISGGTLSVVTSYEGIEGESIEIGGGNISVYSTDDGLNASSDTQTPKITVTGGVLYVKVSGSDVDGIDSNGAYAQTGGVVIVSVPSGGGMSGALDTDNGVTISGGSLIVLGSSSAVSSGGGASVSVKAKALNGSYAAGTYTIACGSTTVLTFTLDTTYSKLYIASDALQTGTCTLQRDGTTVTSWTQS